MVYITRLDQISPFFIMQICDFIDRAINENYGHNLVVLFFFFVLNSLNLLAIGTSNFKVMVENFN
jgi:phage-related holin